MSLSCSPLYLRCGNRHISQQLVSWRDPIQLRCVSFAAVSRLKAGEGLLQCGIRRSILQGLPKEALILSPTGIDIGDEHFLSRNRSSQSRRLQSSSAGRSTLKSRRSKAQTPSAPSPSQPRYPQRNRADYRLPSRTKFLRLASWARPSVGCIGRKDSHPESPPSPNFRYDKDWNAAYHAVVYGGKVVNIRQYPLSLYTKSDLLSRRFTGPRLTRADIRGAWLRLRPSSRLPLWQQLMLWCLQNSPARALQLLIAALEGTYIPVPRHIAAECLQNLAIHYLYRPKQLDTTAFHAILRAVSSFVDRGRKSQLLPFVPNQVCFLLIKHSNEKQFLALIGKFQQRGVQIHANTHLQAADRSIEIGDVALALQLLKAGAQSVVNPSALQFQKAFAKLVRVRFDSPSQFSIRMKIVSEVLQMGVQPNLLVYKAILFSAFEDKRISFGIRLFKTLEDRGFEPDSFMYNILIQGAMRSLKQSKVRMLIRIAERNEKLLDDLELTTTILRAISRRRATCYGALLRFYKRHWDLRPLKELGICDEAEEPPLSRQQAVQNKLPEPVTISQMLCVFLRAYRRSRSLGAIYARYQELIRQDHPLISRVGLSDHVANAFLMCFSRTPKTLSLCATVVRDMLDASRSQRLSVKPEQNGIAASPPTVRTWSILAASYFRHGQKQAAEKVLDLMRERGIERQQITWDMIIDGYASLQDVGKVVDTIVGMREAGSTITKQTIVSLRKIGDREKLSDAFQAATGSRPDLESLPEDGQAITEDETPDEASDLVTKKNIEHLQERYFQNRFEQETPTALDYAI